MNKYTKRSLILSILAIVTIAVGIIVFCIAGESINDHLTVSPDNDDPGAAFPILPRGLDVPGRAGETLEMRECPGELARASVVLWSRTAREAVEVSLRGKVPAKISMKLVRISTRVKQCSSVPSHISICTGYGVECQQLEKSLQ